MTWKDRIFGTTNQSKKLQMAADKDSEQEKKRKIAESKRDNKAFKPKLPSFLRNSYAKLC